VTASAALDAVQRAVEHTRRHLFPFRFERWLTLGFVAFLDQCGRSGVGFTNFQVPGTGTGPGGGGGDAAAEIERVLLWLGAHVLLVSVLAAAALAFLVVLTAFVLWINSRGVFIYLDDVASGRADVGRPWREHAGHAASYFAWSFALAMATLTAAFLLVLAGAVTAVFVFREGRPPAVMAVGVVAIVALVLLLLVIALAAGLFSMALRDFVAPLQVRTGQSCGVAARTLLGLLRAHPGVFVVYVLLKFAFAMAVGFAALVVGCCTCCCGFLPIVAQTILQPAYFFERAWPLFLLQRLGYDLVPAGVGSPQEVPP
jgi:hypothetical protein